MKWSTCVNVKTFFSVSTKPRQFAPGPWPSGLWYHSWTQIPFSQPRVWSFWHCQDSSVEQTILRWCNNFGGRTLLIVQCLFRLPHRIHVLPVLFDLTRGGKPRLLCWKPQQSNQEGSSSLCWAFQKGHTCSTPLQGSNPWNHPINTEGRSKLLKEGAEGRSKYFLRTLEWACQGGSRGGQECYFLREAAWLQLACRCEAEPGVEYG